LSNVVGILSISIPRIAVLLNIFLFATLLTAKKNNAVRFLMLLLASFVLWTGGSAFMRSNSFPGVAFWWHVSLIGLFLVPYFYFLVACGFTENRGLISKLLFGIGTVVLTLLNLKDVFLTVPEFVLNDGVSVISYSATSFALIPVVFYAIVMIYSWIILIREVKKKGLPSRYIKPFVVGILILAAGVVADLIPFFNSMPMDTLACAINALCIYIAFSRKRLYPKDQVLSNGATFVVAIIITAILIDPIGLLLSKIFGESLNTTKEYFILIICCAVISVLLFLGLNVLRNKLFIKDKNKKEDLLKQFSSDVNNSLNQNEILNSFLELINNEIPVDDLNICMMDEEDGAFKTVSGLNSLEEPLVISANTPLIDYLRKKKQGTQYSDFETSNEYRSMWEKEKELFSRINASYILPFATDTEIMGFAVFCRSSVEKEYGYDEINFLESVAAVAAIALKNAKLYTALEKEAQLDTLTNLYNRRYFNKRLNETVNNNALSPVSLVLFNLDDMSLYNELYGNDEGDKLIIRFSEILSSVFGSKGTIARWGGKEFAALLPLTDSITADQLAHRVKEQMQLQLDEEIEKTKKFMSFSAGVCTYPAVASNANQLVSYANMAVFNIKQNGKAQILIYDNNFSAKSKDNSDKLSEITATVYALTAAVDAKDHYTFNHSRAVSEYATKLARFAGYSDDFIECIRQAGLLHDIGKIGIPDSVLTKNGRLSDDEYTTMKKHPALSIEMVRHLPDLDYVIPAVIGHHERYDGKGYPRGLAGEEIPLSARCLAIADAFDAMVSKRCYKEKMPVETAISEILKNLGKQFDPELGRLFVEKIESGEIEVVDY